ncbi:MAG: alpha-amylase [Lachnospiraceae bacterium]|nr:alpha-amylase [Lachnospiraceae bacterium]
MKKREIAARGLALAGALALALNCAACGAKKPAQAAPEASAPEAPAAEEVQTAPEAESAEAAARETEAAPQKPAVYPTDDYRTTYEVFVYSFCDSDGDGIGDLKGLTQKLDYIGDGDPQTAEDLDCSQIWVMPIFPSPTYHKYDVTDYEAIDPQYGTMSDFDELLSDCHERGIRLILDLPVNHTSTEHPWFQAAAEYLAEHAPAEGLPETAEDLEKECPYLDYYNFSDTKQAGYEPLGETGWFYEARFWSGMPDLNLSSETVRGEIEQVIRFWLEKGVDGFRLDAVTSYFTDSHDDSIQFLSWFVDTAMAINPEVYLVGEAWESQQVYARYYGSGLDSLFDFAFAGQDGIIANVVRGSRGPGAYIEAMEAEESLFSEYNTAYVNAPFYTNHDMARSTGYYAYDDGTKTKFAEGLNLMMPGNAFLYYGEELGLKGSGKDENKRAPMPWESDPGAPGMCQGPPDMDPQQAKFGSLSEQIGDPASVWSYVRDGIRIRNTYPEIARGKTREIKELRTETAGAFERITGEDSAVLIAINAGEESTQLTLPEEAAAKYTVLSDELETGEEKAALSDGVLTLPAYGIAILTP